MRRRIPAEVRELGTRENKELVREYLRRVETGDPRLPELLADDVVWWIPPGSMLGGTLRGKAAVLDLLGRASELYSADPLRIGVERLVAEDDAVCAQLVIEARTAAGREYRNHYHLAFEIRDGRVASVKEYVDTAYANERLGNR